jgi:hypothetical protein
MPANRSQPVYAKYIEHVPPDVTAGIYWTKNRMPERWRDQQQIDHVLGKYIISDQPMSISSSSINCAVISSTRLAVFGTFGNSASCNDVNRV